MLQNNNVKLTPEQKARIEENKKRALERLKTRNQQNPVQSANQSPKILPSKGFASSHRVNPYLKPPVTNKLQAVAQSAQQSSPVLTNNNTKQINNQKSSPVSINNASKQYTKPQSSPVSKANQSKPKWLQYAAKSNRTLVKCNFEMISESRFQVKPNRYDERIIEEFRKIPSRLFDFVTKIWSFKIADYNNLVKLLQAFDYAKISGIPEFVIKNMQKQSPFPDESCLEQIESTLLSTLLPFQREGVCYGISKNGRCMIADDMGLGKTRQAIGIADFYKGDWPLLIVTNASTRQFWADEVDKLLPYLLFNDVYIIRGTSDYAEEFSHAKVTICSYSYLQRELDELMRVKYGVIIFDESHSLKNSKSKQTQNAEKISKTASRIIMLTGTPALSRPAELYPQLLILDPHFVSFRQFTTRYSNAFQTKFGWDYSGSSNLDELNILLRKRFLIRRVKADVCIDLSAKERQIVTLENYKYNREFDEELDEIRDGFMNAKNDETEKMRRIQWYQATAKVKAFGACTFVLKYLQDHDEKVLVFAHHAVMMDALSSEIEKAGFNYIRIDGKVSGELRAERVDLFQHDPVTRVAVLSIRSCNAGITLTAGSTIIFAELDWNPSTMIQAEARAHRIGQENEVKVYFLLAQDTSDDVMWHKLNEKQKVLGKSGLVDEVENLAVKSRKSTFDVKEKMFKTQDGLIIPKNEMENKHIDYFKDDDMNDEELLELISVVENLQK